MSKGQGRRQRRDVAARLGDALGDMSLVRLRRSPHNADRSDGFVLGVGRKWVLIAPTRAGGRLDGLVAVRLKDVVGVEKDTTFEARFARSQADWPPTAPMGLNLDSTTGVIRDLSAISPLIGIEQERRFKSAITWIGTVDEIGKGWLWLNEVRPDATWRKRPRGYRLKRITKVIVADEYLTALTSVAGRGPQASDNEPQRRVWASVRCVIRHQMHGEQVYEERVTLWHTTSLDQALERAESEARTYAADVDAEWLGIAQGYLMADAAGDGAEVFSLMRTSALDPGPYLDHFFDTGTEKTVTDSDGPKCSAR